MKNYYFTFSLITAGLISTVQVSAQKEIARELSNCKRERLILSPPYSPVWWQACHRSNEGTSCSQVAF